MVKELDFTQVESSFDYEEYLLNLLNNGLDIEKNYDAKEVKGNYRSSTPFLLEDGSLKKTIVSALHIPDGNGGVRHYSIEIFRFRRGSKQKEWKKAGDREGGYTYKLNEKEIKKLKVFFDKQDKIVDSDGQNKFHAVISSSSRDEVNNIKNLVNSIKEDEFDLSNISEKDKDAILKLVKKISNEGEAVVLEKKIFEQLQKGKTSQRSLVKYKEDLKDFKKLIQESSTTETNMQNFLADRVWFFGLKYFQSHTNSVPKFRPITGSEYDFLLEGFNQIYDIAELKGPNAKLIEVDGKSERKTSVDPRIDYRYSFNFSRALHQVMDYMSEFEYNFDHIKKQHPSIKDFMYPQGLIVISKRSLFPNEGKNSKDYLDLLNRQFSSIEILTYDDLADRAEIIINFIEKLNK